MRWPCVSRAAYDAQALTVQVLTAQFDWAKAEIARLQQELAVRQVTPMNGIPVPDDLRIPKPKPADPIKQVIREQSAGDRKLEGHLRSYANELRANGMKPDDIAAELTRWTTSEDIFLPMAVTVGDEGEHGE